MIRPTNRSRLTSDRLVTPAIAFLKHNSGFWAKRMRLFRDGLKKHSSRKMIMESTESRASNPCARSFKTIYATPQIRLSQAYETWRRNEIIFEKPREQSFHSTVGVEKH